MSHCTGLSKVFRYFPITHIPVVVPGNSRWVAGDQDQLIETGEEPGPGCRSLLLYLAEAREKNLQEASGQQIRSNTIFHNPAPNPPGLRV